jgi:DNA-binding NtrC family response regulator
MTRAISIVRDTECGPEKLCTVCREWWPADAEFFGVRHDRGGKLSGRCKACDAQRHRRQYRAKKDRELPARAAQLAPLGIAETARRLRRSPHTLYRVAQAHGIEFARQHKQRQEAAIVPHIRRNACRMRQIDLAAQLGISRTTLRRLAKLLLIDFNSRAH